MKQSRTPLEARRERKNETIILNKLDQIMEAQSDQNIEIAVIKTKAEETEKHLGTLNGKVSTQEGRQQATDTAVSLNAKAIEVLLGNQKSEKSFWERNFEKLFWVMALAILGWTKLHQ